MPSNLVHCHQNYFEVAVAVIFRISSLAALIALAAALAAVMAALSALRHHENIRRLLKGEEPRIGKK